MSASWVPKKPHLPRFPSTIVRLDARTASRAPKHGIPPKKTCLDHRFDMITKIAVNSSVQISFHNFRQQLLVCFFCRGPILTSRCLPPGYRRIPTTTISLCHNMASIRTQQKFKFDIMVYLLKKKILWYIYSLKPSDMIINTPGYW